MVARGSRRVLTELWKAALDAVEPKSAVERALQSRGVRSAIARGRRVGVFAVGKASAAMAAALPGQAPRLVIVPKGYRSHARGRVLRASHPEPDSSSVRAAREALRFFASFGPQDVIVCLISGGASSLLCLPKPGVSLAEKRRRVRRLMDEGASIVEINRLRTRLSAVKGGRLGRATKARLITLVLSDVPGDRPKLVGSGPTIRRRKGDLVRVVARNRDGLEAAARRARELGFLPRIRPRRLRGEAGVQGAELALEACSLSPGQALLAGGETTVSFDAGFERGSGGRCLEFGAGASFLLDAHALSMLAAGSDGIDGNTRSAGAFIDGSTLARAGVPRVFDALLRSDTAPLFWTLGDLFTPGPTGTNVGDWVFVYREKRAGQR